MRSENFKNLRWLGQIERLVSLHFMFIGRGFLSIEVEAESPVALLPSVCLHVIPSRLLSKRVSIGWSASGNSKERPVIFS